VSQIDLAPEADGRVPNVSPLVPGALCLAFVLAIAWLPGAGGTPWPSMGLWAAAFCAYVGAALAHGRRPLGRRGMWTLAIVGRLALLPRDPHFSDDIYRYLWDGWVQAHGVNPYLYAPEAAALEPLRTGWHALINHPSISTIYPPGAQLVFWALALLGPSVILFKAAWVAADLGVGWVLDRLTSRRDGPPGLAPLLYLWSPLVLVEVAWSGHVEPLGILPMMAALLFLGRRNHPGEGAGIPNLRSATFGGALLGLGATIKLAPAAAIPAAARRRAVAAAAGFGTLILLSLPYVDAGPSLFRGLLTYVEHWESNAGLFRALAAVLGADAVKALGAAGIVGCALFAAQRRWSVERALYWTLGIAIVLSPTIHPWYVLWILPLAALRGGRAWLLLSGTVFMAYWGLDAYQSTGSWPEPLFARLAIHGPFLALLGIEATSAKRRPRRGDVTGREETGEEGRRQDAAADKNDGRDS
jgi:hypothetical protein